MVTKKISERFKMEQVPEPCLPGESRLRGNAAAFRGQ
jgi:hypothetical protein